MKKTNSQHIPYQEHYRGRFAPSPSGELHFGSLLAAMASYADARHHQGDWLVRIDDIDSARVVAGSDKHILSTLEACGFQWDESIDYQSQHIERYQHALDLLQQNHHCYPCTCSRKQLKTQGYTGIYPGLCRANDWATMKHNNYAIRLKVSNKQMGFTDRIQQEHQQILSQDVGDFIIYRRDQVFSYQLSMVVDDFYSGITQVVRGYDLLDSTIKQMYLQQLLGYPTPIYAHIPLAISPQALKLSKLSQAKKITCDLKTLVQAAQFLGQKILMDTDFENKNDFWQYLIRHWDINTVPRMEKQMVLY